MHRERIDNLQQVDLKCLETFKMISHKNKTNRSRKIIMTLTRKMGHSMYPHYTTAVKA